MLVSFLCCQCLRGIAGPFIVELKFSCMLFMRDYFTKELYLVYL